MDTYYIEGCRGEEPEIVYFDKIYNPVMTLIYLDNRLQEEIENHIITEENLKDNIDDYSGNTLAMEKSYNIIMDFITLEKKRIVNVEIFENNNQLQYSRIELFDTYYSELSKAIPQLLKLIKSEDVNNKESEQLNSIYPSLQNNLDEAIDKFYVPLEKYANKYNIELE